MGRLWQCLLCDVSLTIYIFILTSLCLFLLPWYFYSWYSVRTPLSSRVHPVLLFCPFDSHRLQYLSFSCVVPWSVLDSHLESLLRPFVMCYAVFPHCTALFFLAIVLLMFQSSRIGIPSSFPLYIPVHFDPCAVSSVPVFCSSWVLTQSIVYVIPVSRSVH